jgi:hypothetical protein
MNIKHIPERWSDLRDWADNYEQKTMYPTKNSHQLAETTLAIVLGNTPSLLRGFKKRVFISLMDNRLRIAMKYPPQSKYIHLFTRGFFEFRKILLRNFFLPRRKPLSNTPKNKNKYGRYNRIFAEQTEVIVRVRILT